MHVNIQAICVALPLSVTLATSSPVSAQSPGAGAAPHPMLGSCRADQDFATVSADSALLRIAVVLGRGAPAVQRIWPGYWPATEEVLLSRGDSAVLLIARSPLPPGIRPVERQDLAADQPTPVYLFRGPIREFWPAFGLRPLRLSDPKALWHWEIGSRRLGRGLEVIYHEHFHRFQVFNFRHFSTPRGSDAPFVRRMREPEFARRVEIEHRMLSSALESADADSLRALLQGYLSVRHTRTSSDSVAQWSERQMERIEGVAQYVGLEAVRRVLDCDRVGLRADLQQQLEAKARNASDSRIYFTGAALSYLLDQMGEDWKRKVQDGAYLDQLLAAAVDFDAGNAPQQAHLWIQRFAPAEPQ